MGDWRRTVKDLEKEGTLLVQDGNHGEYRPRPAEFGDVGTAFIRAADLKEGRILFESAQKINGIARDRVRKGIGASNDVILSHKGTVGKVSFAPAGSPPFVCSPQTTFWRSMDHDVIDPMYLYAFLRSDSFQVQLRSRENESDMAGYVSLTEQRRLQVTVPPIDLQRAIAGVLEVLDGRINASERIASIADELIRCIYSSALAAPGAREMALFDAMDIAFGAPFASSDFNSKGNGRPLLRIRDLKTFRPQVWTTQQLDKELMVAPGDTVAGMDAEFRPTFWLGESALLNQRVLHARSLVGGGESLCREALRGPLAMVEGYKTGTTVAHLNKRDLATVLLEIPSADAISSFEAATKPLHERIVACAAEARAAAALRDTLLPQLMSGKLRVRDAERIVEDAV
ncbi:hypothetical protein WDV06_08295 [Streptomyces racemochromogenes]|uniref:Type I restriction modification DNA specificity domain-containing protein n=1 Tax=Streptomyces racemochromogenes TaxID=67353 RepID=A0ABW7PAM0_9ACTN